jgi:hypothetical protein
VLRRTFLPPPRHVRARVYGPWPQLPFVQNRRVQLHPGVKYGRRQLSVFSWFSACSQSPTLRGSPLNGASDRSSPVSFHQSTARLYHWTASSLFRVAVGHGEEEGIAHSSPARSRNFCSAEIAQLPARMRHAQVFSHPRLSGPARQPSPVDRAAGTPSRGRDRRPGSRPGCSRLKPTG